MEETDTDNSFRVAALYKFVPLEDFEAMKKPFLKQGNALGILGTILLASEGINGTIAGTDEGIEAMLAFLREDPRLNDLEAKFAHCQLRPFDKFKVKLKEEIVRMGVPGIDPLKNVGKYVEPKDWNALIEDPEVIVIDTRNHYETLVGKFKNAVDPDTNDFRHFPEWVTQNLDPEKHKKVAMYCTGGIRCEKSTSLLVQQGFEEVYHLKGGILKYLEEVDPEDSIWEGDCFVFDERIAVNEKLEPGDYLLCEHCQGAVSLEDRKSPLYKEGECCPHCYTRPRKGEKKYLTVH
ncbi:rhodanese-related sulfurtransferase [Rubellicoccus peritrichatus]|uniref:tRNA uridine(34) hydroxylase n=1 Tax=Rubellicoccus peritrichatus TaxID=3080537 RepID=A0AAQ3L733_9BACT|nr:rhodanese-related sulfurtransferase [Puniceicoccus sp. CR14]WOO40769.1 rhodanese-related sulfurtransferase [Puniceicoccus sp. CR14]